MFARPPSLPRLTKRFSNSRANLRKLPIGYRQILGTGEIEAGLRISMTKAQEVYRRLETHV